MKTNKSRASKFLETVREVVARRCCAATSDVVAELGLSRNTAYHVLRRLHETGDVEKHMLGGTAYWCIPGKSPVSCDVKLRQLLIIGLCRMINGARGGIVVVSAAELLRAAGYATTAPPLLAVAAGLFEMLHLHMEKKRKRRYVYFVVDVDKARRLCLSTTQRPF